MKPNEIERKQVSNYMDPFKMISIQQENIAKMEEEKKKAKEDLLEEASQIVRMSGYDEAMMRKDIQIQDKKIIYDCADDDNQQTTIKSENTGCETNPEFDPNDETDNQVYENENDDDQKDNEDDAKLDEFEEDKNSFEDTFDIIEDDFYKQIEDYKKQKLLEVRTIKDLYVDHVNEDEVFWKDINLLDIVNTVWLEGKLSLTRYKLEFSPYERIKEEIESDEGSQRKKYIEKFRFQQLPAYRERYFKIPVHMICSINKNFDKKNPNCYYIDINTKDYRGVRLLVNTLRECDEIFVSIKQQAMPGWIMSSLFMFKYNYEPNNYGKQDNEESEDSENISLTKCERLLRYTGKPKFIYNGWKVYNFLREFKRQGVDTESKSFRAYNLWSSKDESKLVCGSYPKFIYVPFAMKSTDLRQCALFRSRNRLPALSYYYQPNGSSIWRCAQNLSGIMNKQVIIVDARSQIAAYANRAKGGGFEQEDYYTNCKLIFADIENIHTVRDSYQKCFQLCESYFKTRDNKKILSKIEGAGWMNLLRNILFMANEIATIINLKKQNVVIHCTDGWDRTAQLSSIAQILLDPYFRTLEGFEVLIEKEWISFGYQFQTRWGHFYTEDTSPDERSPVFVQFLDCVFQLLVQFPTAFQFNSKLLLFLAHHVYSWKFGTFLFDNDRMRSKFKEELKNTTSIWTYVNDNCYDFLNPLYNKTKEVLEPNCDYLALEFWKDHFLQWIEYSEYKPGYNLISSDDHKEELMKDAIEENLMLKKRIKQLDSQLKNAKIELSK